MGKHLPTSRYGLPEPLLLSLPDGGGDCSWNAFHGVSGGKACPTDVSSLSSRSLPHPKAIDPAAVLPSQHCPVTLTISLTSHELHGG